MELSPRTEALNYIDQVLAALSYAHGRHIVHRDIKPANMMLTPQGVVKLMDFGLARSADEVGLTMTGSTVGSLDYLSPEQVQSHPTDERSDLYSVGVSLYQMVTGQRMFSATSSYSIMEAHVKETPRPPMEVVPSLPKPVSDLIVMAVAKDPAQRFQTADAFRAALAQVKNLCPPVPGETFAPTMTLPVTPSTTPVPGRTPSPVTPVAPVPPVVPVTPAAAMATPLPVRAGRGGLLAVVVILIVVVLAGAWYYKTRQDNELARSVAEKALSSALAQSAANAAMQQTTPPPSTPPADSANTPAQAAIPPPPAAPPRGKHPDQSNGMGPGGSASDLPPQPDPAEQKRLLDELEKDSDQINGRASAAEASLDTLEQQMHQSGLGLRGDMVAARSNLRNDLAKAKQALDSADTDRARHFLDLAQHEVEKLEAFLGHR